MADNPFPGPIDPDRLREQLVDYFTLEDLRDLCFTLGVDFDVLPGEDKKGKSRELVIYCRNRAMIDQLVAQAQKARPAIDWTFQPAVGAQPGHAAESPEQHLYELVKAFNHNRHQPISSTRTRNGDDIAYRMREMAPELDGRFDVEAWLISNNIGKRVAAVGFLDWKQDTEYFTTLLDRLPVEKPFVQFHILIALNSLMDQLEYGQMELLRDRLADYDPGDDSSRRIWSRSLQSRVEEWFRVVGPRR